MNRVITINLNGNAYQLEESGYEALRAYLDLAARRLEGNPDKDEIVADIEQAIADKFRAVLGANKTVVITKEVTGVIAAMGPVEDGSTEAGSTPTSATSNESAPAGKSDTAGEPKSVRALYRIEEGAVFTGVCTGLAAFWKMDVRTIRWVFVSLCIFYGIGVLVYLILALIIPAANTPGEKAAASGTGAATAQEFIRRAKAGYYDGMRTMHDKQAHKEWKRKFKQEMRNWKHGFEYQMHQNAQQWQQNWSEPLGQPQHPKYWVGLGFTLEILQWVRLLFFGLGIYAVYSLVTKGSVFGLLLPAGIPTWIGIILIIIIYKILIWPIKAMHYGYYTQGMPCGGYGAGPLGGLVWLGFLAVLIWCLDQYVPQFHEALKQLPPWLHQGVDSIQHWLERA